jgi:hypothetical protein
MIVYPVYKYYRDRHGEVCWNQYTAFRTEEAQWEFLDLHSEIENDDSGGKTWYDEWPAFEIEDK